ncbi:MAG: hypothetical protein FJZ96_12360 [Chloroflexi bacterium]|nr:hypothetical protein [Chloroflexota bacterium]
MNPFTFGNPIKEPERFHGRKNEIRQIVNRLASSAHESTSIIGERRIGKTSLLNYLSNQAVMAGLGLAPEHYCLVYVDFQGLTDITPQRFWQRVLNKMARSICDESLKPGIQELSKKETFDLFDLEDIFQAASDRGFTTVLFLDEFEYVTQNPNFKSDFFGGLRALASHSGLALIPSTRRELVDLCHSDEIKGSPFFNIFANVVLRPFSQAEVVELISGYTSESPYAFTTEESAIIHDMGGGYPFFVQAAGHYVMEAKMQGLGGETLERFVTDNFDQQADPHYTYMWSHCSESEKITLLVLLTLSLQKASKKTIPNLENLTNLRARAPQDLVSMGKRGLIAERDGLFSIFSPSFERWVRKEILAAPGEEESQASADEWVKTGGEKDIKAATGMLPKFKRKYWPILADVAKELSFEFAAAGAMELIKILM